MSKLEAPYLSTATTLDPKIVAKNLYVQKMLSKQVIIFEWVMVLLGILRTCALRMALEFFNFTDQIANSGIRLLIMAQCWFSPFLL